MCSSHWRKQKNSTLAWPKCKKTKPPLKSNTSPCVLNTDLTSSLWMRHYPVLSMPRNYWMFCRGANRAIWVIEWLYWVTDCKQWNLERCDHRENARRSKKRITTYLGFWGHLMRVSKNLKKEWLSLKLRSRSERKNSEELITKGCAGSSMRDLMTSQGP